MSFERMNFSLLLLSKPNYDLIYNLTKSLAFEHQVEIGYTALHAMFTLG
jgi:hypothetical protein